MEIFCERLSQEHQADVVATMPGVPYMVRNRRTGEETMIERPADFPEPDRHTALLEPVVRATIIATSDLTGKIMSSCMNRRGVQDDLEYLDENRVVLTYRLPFAEIVTDFFDELKSISSGYASLDYEFDGYQEADIVKLDILLNGTVCDALATIVHRDRAQRLGRELCAKLKTLVPRQLYDVAIQAAIGAKIVGRENIKALRKDTTAKCYGGDHTRKRKLLEKQKAGKKRSKRFGNVEIPTTAFAAVLRK